MPTYEYRCPDGHTFEVFQKMSDPPGARCPECGKDAERQVSGGAGVLFKGSGFYITDYRSEDYRKAAASEAGGDAASAGDRKSGGADRTAGGEKDSGKGGAGGAARKGSTAREGRGGGAGGSAGAGGGGNAE